MKVASAIVWLLFSLSCWAQSQPPIPAPAKSVQQNETQSAQTAKDRSSEARGTQDAPLFVKGVASPQTQEDAEHQKWERHEKPTLDRLLTWSTVALSAFTFLLFAFTAALWWVTYRLSKEAKAASASQAAQMSSALSVAQKSADAATQMAQDAAENAQRHLRAYVSIESASMAFPRDCVPKATVTFKNTGLTPAYDVAIWIHQWCAEHPLRITLPTPPEDFPMAKTTIGSGISSHIQTHTDQPLRVPGGQKGIGTPEATIYVYGAVVYRDVFGAERKTTFRLIYGGPEGVNLTSNLSTDTEGNYAT